MPKSVYHNYIILPNLGLRYPENYPASDTQQTVARLTTHVHLDEVFTGGLGDESVVLDTTGRGGARLIRIADADLPDLRAQLPGMRIVPEVFYYPQRWHHQISTKPSLLAGQVRAGVRIQLADAKTGAPVARATVVAFTNFDQREGEQAAADAQGVVRFKTIGNRVIDQFFVYPKAGYWSLWRKNLTLTNNDIFSIQPIKLSAQGAKEFFYPPIVNDPLTGQGLKVGVIDTGTGPHPDLVLAGGACTVTGEDPTDFTDVDEHGTHVSGIIGARGNAPTGVRGVAPGVALYAYRVFGKGVAGASNFAIIKAIERAVADGCDIINMSLGGGPADDATEDAISFAHANGTLCFVATGNDGRQPVSFPASFSLSLAVSAMGRKKTFPASTTDAPNTMAPFGTDKKNFVAAFSNVGPDVDFTAPGVGIVSSVPGGYAPMSGTSMACPMAAGVAARLLAAETALLAMPRNALRAEAMVRFLATKVKPLGFGPTFEGIGMLFV